MSALALTLADPRTPACATRLREQVGVLLMLAAASTLAGCSASASLKNPFAAAPARDERPRLAAFAASSRYPDTQPSDELRLTALIDREADTVQVINPTDRALRDVNVWVNGSFVNHVDAIPAHGSVTLHRARFYDAGGNTLSSMNTSAFRVELQSEGEFYKVLGPVFE